MGTVAHLDMDAFYVSVELRRRPDLKGLPVVVSGSGPRAVVTTASYEARRFGVGSAIPASRARRLCPDAVFLAPDFEYYRAASREVFEVIRRHVTRVEAAGLDECYLDLDGMLAPNAAMRRLLADIDGETGLRASVGIGPNKLVAKVASDAEKPRGFVVLTREQAAQRFAGSPPALVPGIGPKTAAALAGMGIATLGALAGASEERLVERFGPRLGPDLARRARFEHDGTVTTDRIAVSESRETTFPTDISEPQELERILLGLANRLAGALERQGRRGRTIAIKVRLDDFSTFTRARTLREAVNDPETVGRVALDLLREFEPSRPVRLLGVRVAAFEQERVHAEDQLALPV